MLSGFAPPRCRGLVTRPMLNHIRRSINKSSEIPRSRIPVPMYLVSKTVSCTVSMADLDPPAWAISETPRQLRCEKESSGVGSTTLCIFFCSMLEKILTLSLETRLIHTAVVLQSAPGNTKCRACDEWMNSTMLRAISSCHDANHKVDDWSRGEIQAGRHVTMTTWTSCNLRRFPPPHILRTHDPLNLKSSRCIDFHSLASRPLREILSIKFELSIAGNDRERRVRLVWLVVGLSLRSFFYFFFQSLNGSG
ncbi:hypothetical protein BO78DRAFT_239743 [Aspergillus sclerotiicarbonarius CBS 121057]|uniref:Uncharacterized protein n=1 Tax=Aspergillus sclerotiicarbonarius (strain CBS 121057 / IBT 28362) TaxID=1448318 RepID=A0A319DXC4_ASPSB|nr:hypothetical protein BO78DRAFT_239743 [Aspergillus sclerotiicarbonarius CBS 121057]